MRFPPRSAADTEGENARVLGKLEASGQLNEISARLANSPQAFRPYVLMSNALLNQAALPARLRELVILLLASVPYERAEHERMSAGLVTEAEQRALRRGREAVETFAADERLVLELALELHAGDVTRWDLAVETLGVEAALDLALTVAWWGGFIPIALRAVGLEGET